MDRDKLVEEYMNLMNFSNRSTSLKSRILARLKMGKVFKQLKKDELAMKKFELAYFTKMRDEYLKMYETMSAVVEDLEKEIGV